MAEPSRHAPHARGSLGAAPSRAPGHQAPPAGPPTPRAGSRRRPSVPTRTPRCCLSVRRGRRAGDRSAAWGSRVPARPARPAGPQRPPTPAGLTAGSRRRRAGCSARAACARTAWLEPLAAPAGAEPHSRAHRSVTGTRSGRSAGPARAFMDGPGGGAAPTRPAPAPPPHLAGPRPRALPGSEGAYAPTADWRGRRGRGTRGRGSRDPNRSSGGLPHLLRAQRRAPERHRGGGESALSTKSGPRSRHPPLPTRPVYSALHTLNSF